MEKQNNPLIEELEQFKTILPAGMQKRYYEILLERAKPIEVVPLREVFSEEEIRLIRCSIKPKQRECYKNAMHLVMLFPTRVEYVEGKILAGGVIGVEHGFNRVGDKYIDITAELALKQDVLKEQYISLSEFSREEAMKLLLEYSCYTFFTNEILYKQIKSEEVTHG